MLYRAIGTVIPLKPRRKRKFIIEIVRHSSGKGLQIRAKMWWGHNKRPSYSCMYCDNMLQAIHYLHFCLEGRNKDSKIIVKRQTKGHRYL